MIARLFAGRLRAMFLRLKGANVGRKASVGARLVLRHPRGITMGDRVEIEHDVYLKLAGRAATLAIGDYSFVAARCVIHVAENVTIGAHTLVGTGVVIADHTHNSSRAQRFDEQGIASTPVTIGDDVLINPGVIILPGVTVGDGAIVAAGAVVATDVAPYTIVGGIPARVIGQRQ